MTTRRFYLLLTVAFVLCSYNAMAQTEYYHYRVGKKLGLTLNESKLGLNVPKENKELNECIKANAQILLSGYDNVTNSYYITRADYEKIASLDIWKEYSKSVILTRCFFQEDGLEVFESAKIDLGLKREEDVDLLNYYIDKYKLRIRRHVDYMPLSYGLAITVDSGIGALECENTLYETGYFSWVELCLAYKLELDGQESSGITTPKKEESSAVFDLQGRRVQGEPRKGVYVSGGRKYVVR